MNMLETLARVAITMAQQDRASHSAGLQAAQPARAQAGGFGDLLGQILGGGMAAPGAASGTAIPRSGGMGAALDELSRLSQPGRSAAPRGGFAEAAARPPTAPQSGGSFGDLLNDLLAGASPKRRPTPVENDLAGLLLSATLQAAKADGKLDEAEKQRILKALGHRPDREELAWLNAELAKPVDIEGLARACPQGAEAQVYMMSLMAIDLDAQPEAAYLHGLAGALGLPRQSVNAIHDRAGAPRLYR